jgi:protoporphyrinogen oxidase
MEAVELTRRQVLEALLAAPVALAACKKAPPPPVAGAIRGASIDVGHLLQKVRGSEPSGEPKRVGVAIVGAGPSGLSAAWRLERLGVTDYVLFDLEDRAGGTSRFGDDGVVPYPWGAHYLPMPSPHNRSLVALLGEMGAILPSGEGAEEQLVRAPEERVFYLGKWYEGLYLRAGATAADLAELARFEVEIARLVAWRDPRGRPAFTIPIAHATTDETITSLDRITMEAWLRDKGFQSTRLRWLVDYACRDDYGLLARDTSAYAGLFYFASRTFEAGDAAAPLLSWPNGNGHLVEHLAKVARERVRASSLVTDIAPRDDGVDLTVLDATTKTLSAWRADHVVFAAPKFTASRVIRPWRDAPPAHLASLDYGAWMVANLHLSGRPTSRGFATAWDNVLYDSPSLGYVVATHQKLLDHGRTVWTYYYPLTDADPKEGRKRLLAPDHAAWCDVILSDLSRAHDALTSHVERIDVWRWGHAMARPRVGAMWSGARTKAAEPLGRVHFAHSDLSGMGLFEEAQYWGVAAAEAIVRARGRDVVSLL